MRVDNHAAADGLGRRGIAQDKWIASTQRQGPAQTDLQPALTVGRQRIGIQQAHIGHRLGGARKELDLRIVFQQAVDVGQLPDMRVDQGRRTDLSRISQHVASLNVAATDAGDVHGHAAARQGPFHLLLIALQAADAPDFAMRLQFHSVPNRQRPAGQRASDHSAEAA